MTVSRLSTSSNGASTSTANPTTTTSLPRNQFVGLEGAFGTVKVGRHDTALKQAQGFDLFDDLEGDIAGVLNGENRLKDYIGYISPALGKSSISP